MTTKITSDNIVPGSLNANTLAEGVVGAGGAEVGTESNRPSTPSVGTIYFNTDEDTLQQYTSSGWVNVGASLLSISTISGNIYNGLGLPLTITGSGFGLSATVRFSYEGTTTDIVVTPVDDTTISVSPTSDIYNQLVDTTISISVVASGRISNASTKTILQGPTGGTRTVAGGYVYHTFTSSGSLTVPSGFNLSSNYLLVAAGGSGGTRHAGGGGAGGYISGDTTLSESTTYTFTVGSGNSGASGGNSTAFGQTAVGGGKGGDNGATGSSGGSGGGGSNNKAGGSGTAGQGNSGGSSVAGAHGGGGGGASASGGSVSSAAIQGTGGIGTQWLNGVNYAGGGGGGGDTGTQYVENGNAFGGGRGSGRSANSGENGTINTGGGGGGGGASGTSSSSGGLGGSGVVIVRYQLT